jgi:hypothetical protein
MLAHDWLYGRRVNSKWDHVVERFLTLPTKFDKHSSIAVLNMLAERIVFTDDVPTMLYDMHQNKQLTFEGVLSSARLPYDCFWLEYSTLLGTKAFVYKDHKLERVHYGALIQRINLSAVRMHIVIGMKMADAPVQSSLAYVVEFPTWPPVVASVAHEGKRALAFGITYAYNRTTLTKDSEEGKAIISELASVVNEMIFGIFLITAACV